MTIDEIVAQIEANMVTIPGGTYLMGSPASEPQRGNGEGPQQRLTIPAFLMSKTEVTFAQWDACVADGGCDHKPDDECWGRGNRPVINVSYDDITQQFIPWLNRKTGKTYRLPSEGEWEYAARGGTTTRFHTGDCITTAQANFNGNNPAQGCPKGEVRGKTTPVGSFAPNAFDLHDMHGNVWEWCEDVWGDTLKGIPLNGSPRLVGEARWRVLRGGSWNDFGRSLRSAYRDFYERVYRDGYGGFRLARSNYSKGGGMTDNINSPRHYTLGSIECIAAIQAALGDTQFKGFLRGNVIKYLWRYQDKGGIEDLRKARWYLERLIKEESEA